jgi:hypothetical protein
MCHRDANRHAPVFETSRWILAFVLQKEVFEASIQTNVSVSCSTSPTVLATNGIECGIALWSAHYIAFRCWQNQFTVSPDTTGIQQVLIRTDRPEWGSRDALIKKLSPGRTDSRKRIRFRIEKEVIL